MSKTLPTKSTDTPGNNKTTAVKTDNKSEQLVNLMQEMKGAWNEASGDLLQPRPEAVSQLLKKVLH